MDDSQNIFCCEKCGHAIAASEEGEYPTACPACGELLVIADDEPPPQANRDEEIEAVAIRRIVQERRALLRTRGYYLVLTWACIAVAAQMIWMMVHALIVGGWQNWQVIYPAAALFLVMLARDMWVRAQKLGAQVRASSLTQPTAPPDFTQLSDGSQKWKDLENLG